MASWMLKLCGGIRTALGATRGRVIGMTLGGALAQIGVGLMIGIPAALAAGRVLADQLYGVKTDDPLVLWFCRADTGGGGRRCRFRARAASRQHRPRKSVANVGQASRPVPAGSGAMLAR